MKAKGTAEEKAKVDSAIILAAGMGRRIFGQIPDSPKGFIEIDGLPIIERSIRVLKSAGIANITIVTGYLPEFYENLARKHSGIQTVHNPRYADSGSMYSLFLARDSVEGSFLLLESDIIYERQAVFELLQEGRDHAVLISGKTNSGDEVYVGGRQGNITEITKDRAQITELAGELCGLSLISPGLFDEMNEYARLSFQETLEIHYETDVLAGLARLGTVHYRLVEDLAWSEIDDASHLKRARTEVMPRIKQRDL